MSSETCDRLDKGQEEDQDNRAPWERPELRRLVANAAEGGFSNLDDGNCTGTGNPLHHSCPSDIRLKREVMRVGQLNNGVGVYRFKYLWSDRDYVGVMAQEVATVMPGTVLQGADGYFRVDYARLGLKLQSWEEWTQDQPSVN
jgi:hypothetical protein